MSFGAVLIGWLATPISGPEGPSTGDQHAPCEVGTFTGHSRRLFHGHGHMVFWSRSRRGRAGSDRYGPPSLARKCERRPPPGASPVVRSPATRPAAARAAAARRGSTRRRQHGIPEPNPSPCGRTVKGSPRQQGTKIPHGTCRSGDVAGRMPVPTLDARQQRPTRSRNSAGRSTAAACPSSRSTVQSSVHSGQEIAVDDRFRVGVKSLAGGIPGQVAFGADTVLSHHLLTRQRRRVGSADGAWHPDGFSDSAWAPRSARA